MLIIFDVDGTLIDGESTDWPCFCLAIKTITRLEVSPEMMTGGEVTAQSILRRTLSACYSESQILALERSIIDRYVKNLADAFSSNPQCFEAFPGVKELLQYLRCEHEVTLAIASGDWREAVEFKLKSAGIFMNDVALATASDSETRTEIIRLAAARSEEKLENAVYIGNGNWDFEAARKLGIQFIGVGHDKDRLRAAGVLHLLEDMFPHTFSHHLNRLRAA